MRTRLKNGLVLDAPCTSGTLMTSVYCCKLYCFFVSAEGKKLAHTAIVFVTLFLHCLEFSYRRTFEWSIHKIVVDKAIDANEYSSARGFFVFFVNILTASRMPHVISVKLAFKYYL